MPLRLIKMRIGIYSPNWIGDSVIALTFVQSIRAFESDAEIFIVCKEWVAGVYQEHPAINGVLSFSSMQLSGLANIYKMGSSLKKYNFDKFFTLTDSFRSAFILWLSSARKRYGYSTQFRSIFLTNPMMISKQNIHRSEKYSRLIQTNSMSPEYPRIHLSEKEYEWAQKEMKKLGLSKPIALFPFSVASNRTLPNQILKTWLENTSDQYLVFGSENDTINAERLMKECKGVTIKSICGNYDLRKSIALISACKYSLATDSGLGHVSTALGIPTVSFFGIGVESHTAPRGKNIVVFKHCSPCFGKSCTSKNKNKSCIKKITRSEIDFAVNSITNL